MGLIDGLLPLWDERDTGQTLEAKLSCDASD